jgi:hypothetical protein
MEILAFPLSRPFAFIIASVRGERERERERERDKRVKSKRTKHGSLLKFNICAREWERESE